VTEISAPRQARSRATWARVLDAGVELLAEGGYEALTIGALCERASATPPSIYARAGNKDGLLLAVYEHAMAQITRTAIHPDDGTWDGLSVQAAVTRAVEALCRTWLDNAAVMRPIVHRAAHDPEIFRRGSQASREEARAFRTVLEGAGIVLDIARHHAARDGRTLDLTPKEFAVLEVLLRAEAQLVSAEDLLEQAWDEHADPFTNAVRMAMVSLRRKLGQPPVIETVPRKGYRIGD